MNYLLDTHTLLWWSTEIESLSSSAQEIIEDESNAIFFSVASIWEIQIKVQLGKLKIPEPLGSLVAKQRENGLLILSIAPQHIYAIDNLPYRHKDPFDRMLIAQANEEDLVIITKDSKVVQYDVETLW